MTTENTAAASGETTDTVEQSTALAPPPVDPKLLVERAIMLDVQMGKLGVRRKAKAVKIDATAPLGFQPPMGAVLTDADPKLVSVSAKILDCPEYDAITSFDRSVRARLDEHALPGVRFVRNGVHVVSIDALEELEVYLQLAKQWREGLVELFCDVYEQRCEENDARLQSLADASAHPPIARVRAAFYFDWTPLSFDVPSSLKRLKKGAFEREQQKMASRLQGAAEDIVAGMRGSFLELVESMKTALIPSEDGKKKRFHSSQIENLTKWIALFKSRNVLGDEQLDACVGEMQDLLDGVDAELIRDNDELRDAIATEVTAISGTLASMVKAVPRRSIDFEG